MIKKRMLLIKKTAIYLGAMILLSVTLTGCMGKTEKVSDTPNSMDSDIDIRDSSQEAEDMQTEVKEEAAFPGSYAVPEGWVKAENHSTEGKTFYVEEGHEEDALPDNISVEIGSNSYGAEEHEKFCDAIVRQLAMQLQGTDAEVTGDGTNTDQDYVVYIFTISGEDVVTKQYYVVGDRQYCLVHLTNFTGSESADEAAWAIVNSFVWSE